MTVLLVVAVVLGFVIGFVGVRRHLETVRLRELYPATYSVSYSRVSNNYRSTDGMWTILFKIPVKSGPDRRGLAYGATLNSALREANRKVRTARKDMENLRIADEIMGGVL